MTKKNLVLAGLLSVTAIGGAAFAADSMRVKGPMRADTNGDGVVSRSEFFAAAETRFKKHDANGDRMLAGGEMRDRAGRFARLDTNNDGKLSFEEAAVGTSARFATLDANKDGKLTPEELGPGRGPGHHGPNVAQDDDARPAPGGPGGGWGGMMLRRADTNGDGKISRDEMRAQADERFDRLDTNKDGFIDQAEFQAERGRFAGRRGMGRGGMDDMPPPPPPGAAVPPPPPRGGQ